MCQITLYKYLTQHNKSMYNTVMSKYFHSSGLGVVRHTNESQEAFSKIKSKTDLNTSDSIRHAITQVAIEFGYDTTKAHKALEARSALEYIKEQANEIHPVFKCGITRSVLIRNCLTYYAEKLQVTPP